MQQNRGFRKYSKDCTTSYKPLKLLLSSALCSLCFRSQPDPHFVAGSKAHRLVKRVAIGAGMQDDCIDTALAAPLDGHLHQLPGQSAAAEFLDCINVEDVSPPRTGADHVRW